MTKPQKHLLKTRDLTPEVPLALKWVCLAYLIKLLWNERFSLDMNIILKA